jgi:hypothetical protein
MSTNISAIAKQAAELQQSQLALETAAQMTAKASSHGVQVWSPELVRFLSVSILIFTLSSLILCAVLLWRSKAPGFHVLRVFGVITIIGVSALLLVVGYSNEQLTPIVGLFGAIAGYLLGKDKEPNPQKSDADA